MIYSKTRVVSILLTIGIFFTLSCSHFDRFSSSDESTNNSEDQLELVNSKLQDDPQNIDLQIEKAELLVKIASEYENPSERRPFYSNLRELANSQQSVSGEIHPEIINITNRAWTAEQSRGVRLLQQDQSDLEDGGVDFIIGHFENAITINPDSISTYNLMANTYYRNGRFNDAISTLEDADKRSGEQNPDIKEKLAYLYLESGDIEKSIEIYKELANQPETGAQIRNGLANAYILNQQHDEAISILRELTEQFPTRYEYSEALASQLYFVLSNQLDELATDNNVESISAAGKESLINQINEIDSIFDTLQTKLPFTEDQLIRSGAFYKNTSNKLKALEIDSDESFSNEVETLRMNLLEKALPIWEKLFENHPESTDYIRTLHNIYLELDKVEEAESLQRSFNL